MINVKKRKRIMQRSIKLGHCICDPKKPCPCDLFKEKNICMCAGERLESPTGPVQLTKIVEKPGCASKIDQAFLKQVLKDLPEIEDPKVLVGVPAGDDAGIYDLGNGMALVQTVDVFTPSVDDPYQFGQIAASNSVSDVYAMGGTPLTALSILGFPVRKIPDDAMNQILRGGIDKMKETQVPVIGGHSINDPQIKAGFMVTGLIDKNKIIRNDGAKTGDLLILTKPIGTGIVSFANQIERARPESVKAIADSMTALNKIASEQMVKFGAHACTDVTGFSLMGHLTEMASSSGADVEILFDSIPLFPGVLEYAENGILPSAIERNKESCSHKVTADETLSSEMVDICFDAQTSGGLLIAIEEKKCEGLLKALQDGGVDCAAVIGKITKKGKGQVFLKTDNSRSIPKMKNDRKTTNSNASEEAGNQDEVPCCEDAVSSEQNSQANPETEQVRKKFNDFLSAASSPHGLDAFTKQAMAIALSVAMRCEPCLKMHIKKAKAKGFTQGEIDEAAWMGISFGGSPTMTFYEQIKNNLAISDKS